MTAGFGGRSGNHRTDLFHQLPGGGERLDGPCCDDPVGDPAGEFLLAPFTDDPDEVLFAVVVDYIRRGLATAGVHPHVQRRVKGVRETTFALVQLK